MVGMSADRMVLRACQRPPDKRAGSFREGGPWMTRKSLALSGNDAKGQAGDHEGHARLGGDGEADHHGLGHIRGEAGHGLEHTVPWTVLDLVDLVPEQVARGVELAELPEIDVREVDVPGGITA